MNEIVVVVCFFFGAGRNHSGERKCTVKEPSQRTDFRLHFQVNYHRFWSYNRNFDNKTKTLTIFYLTTGKCWPEKHYINILTLKNRNFDQFWLNDPKFWPISTLKNRNFDKFWLNDPNFWKFWLNDPNFWPILTLKNRNFEKFWFFLTS